LRTTGRIPTLSTLANGTITIKLLAGIFSLLRIGLLLSFAVQRFRSHGIFGALRQRRQFEPLSRKVDVNEITSKHIGTDQPVFVCQRAFADSDVESFTLVGTNMAWLKRKTFVQLTISGAT
jgi:hypothetical protein